MSAGAAGGGAADVTRTADEPHAANFYLPDRRGGGTGDPAMPPHLLPPARRARSLWSVATRAGSRGQGGVAGAPPSASSAPAPRLGGRVLGDSAGAAAPVLSKLRASVSRQQPLGVGNRAT